MKEVSLAGSVQKSHLDGVRQCQLGFRSKESSLSLTLNSNDDDIEGGFHEMSSRVGEIEIEIEEQVQDAKAKHAPEWGTRLGEQARRPVVVGCTMIDMHVSTKIDYQFKVSLHPLRAKAFGVGSLLAAGASFHLSSWAPFCCSCSSCSSCPVQCQCHCLTGIPGSSLPLPLPLPG